MGAVEQSPRQTGHVAVNGETGELVEGGHPRCVGGSGDDRGSADARSYLDGQSVGAAAVAADQGHGKAAGFVDTHHCRRPAPDGEQRGQHPDCRSGGQEHHQTVHLVP